jgi:hypothetical protein
MSMSSEISVVPVNDDLDKITFIDLGPAGIIPQDAGFNTVHLLCQDLYVTTDTLIIDRKYGEYVKATLLKNVRYFDIINWPPSPFFGRITLEIICPEPHDIIWPSWIKWSRNRVPSLSASGNDIFIFTATDHGARVHGSIVGQDYPS